LEILDKGKGQPANSESELQEPFWICSSEVAWEHLI
jgi:hypothetical protein